MKIPEVTTVDFETKPIMPRPDYPPQPVGFSIMRPGEKKSQYYAWGHPVGNNCTKAEGRRVLKQAWKSGPLLFYNSKFDVDVAETHMDCPRIAALDMHDGMFLNFLSEPHARSLALKPSAERVLKMPPTEQQAVARWLIEHQEQLKRDGLLPFDEPRITLSNFGKWICLAPGDLVGKYADGDVIRTYKLFRKQYVEIVERGMLEAYQREQKLMPILLQNEREGMRVDLRLLEKDVKQYSAAMETADNWLRKTLKSPSMNLDSDAEVAEALDRCGIVTEWTKTKTGKNSVSKKNLKPEHFSNKKIASVLGYRSRLTTCINTFQKPWLITAHKTGGIIHTNWSQTRQAKGDKGFSGARTGRLGSSPNFMNIPTDLEKKNDGYMHPKFLDVPELPLMRKYILPDAKDHILIGRDFSSQELRVLAHLAEGEMLDGYNEKPDLDLHKFASDLITQTTGLEVTRTMAKIVAFSIIYGSGTAHLAESLGCSVPEASKIQKAYLGTFPGVADLQKALKARAKAGEPIRTWGGREYYCEEPAYVEKFDRVMTFEYKLLNYAVQSSAADITKEAIIRLHGAKSKGRFMLTVHDEILMSVDKRYAKEAMLDLKTAMNSIELDVPMLSDGETGRNWAAMKPCA